MIREASYDSLLSELGAALSVNEDIGASTEGMLDRLEGDISDLRRVNVDCTRMMLCILTIFNVAQF